MHHLTFVGVITCKVLHNSFWSNPSIARNRLQLLLKDFGDGQHIKTILSVACTPYSDSEIMVAL